MKQSHLFTKTRKDAPKDEVAKNAQLLIRAGFIHKEMAGVYSYLPLGLKVIENIKEIIRKEMNAIGGQELVLTALQEKTAWEKVDRWSDEKVDVWFRTELKGGATLGLGYTHEAALAELMKDFISSYRDLPSYSYQFQTKFRNEMRAKSGIFRGREFLMKDLYSFSANESDLDMFYQKATEAYKKIFNHIGIGEKTYLTVASGEMFGTKYSHEFQTLSDAGEDMIYIHKEKGIAFNEEVLNEETLNLNGVKKEELVTANSVEVGNIYKLGTFYSKPLELTYKNESGEEKPVIMGSYGIGVSRLMGVIVETLSDENGIVWPESVAPFKAHLLCLAPDDENVKMLADDIYRELEGNVLYDDRENARGGEKFADADLMGMPYQIIIGKKSHQDSIEVKNRKTGKVETKSMSEIIDWLQNK
jgi:prolyl-tRNA synthetase